MMMAMKMMETEKITISSIGVSCVPFRDVIFAQVFSAEERGPFGGEYIDITQMRSQSAEEDDFNIRWKRPG